MEYETLITATSMGRNFRESYVDEVLKTNTLNGSLASSYAKEQSMVTQFALQEQENVEQVIWELNYYSFAEDPDKVLDSATPFPTYMYDENKINDIRYLFNSYNVQLTQDNLEANLNGSEIRRDVEPLYKFGQVAPEETTDRIERWLGAAEPLEELPENQTKEMMIKSFKENVVTVLEENPDTTFTFFYAPYPVYNHYRFYQIHPEYLKERLAFKEEVFEILSEYDNAELYDFQDDREITFDIGNYMGDAVHYYEFVNEHIIDTIANEEPVTSKDEYAAKLQNLRQQILEFDIAQLDNEGIAERSITLKK
ncbi:hypothetical protein [Jeotgalibacillus aurantiacus]|uniref:hypothetical protein n=1 Tax=Jeotgalibacillus aurantiacus TaxID=2763266 RepID=UPI001D0A9E42|nr:hypothetical protein [Jeotgalibacillus aurantiacus]